MNGRQVEDIEAHFGNAGEPSLAIPQSSVLSWLRRARTGKEFVPGRIPSSFTIHNDAQFFVIASGEVTNRVFLDDAPHLCFQRSVGNSLPLPAQHASPRQERGSIGACR